MFNGKKLKITACALTGVMTFGLMGLTAGAAEASSHHHERPEYHELAHKHHRDHKPHKENRNTHSQGDVNTAAIVGVAVGAIAGAVIANNT